MRGRQNYIPKPSFHPLPARCAAVNPFLQSLTCCWRLLGFRVVILSYFSRNRRKQHKIAGSQFALFCQKSPPYSGKKKDLPVLAPIVASAATLGPLPQEYCALSTLVCTCSRPSSQYLCSLPAFPLGTCTSTPFTGETSDTGYQGSHQSVRLIARASRQVKSWPLQHRERDFEILYVS